MSLSRLPLSRASAILRSVRSAAKLRPLTTVREESSYQSDLKAILSDLVPRTQAEVKEFRSQHGSKVVGEVTVDMMYGGMRGIRGLVTETSLLDPEEGIRFRGYSIPELQELLPKASGGEEPLPEGIFFLMLTGQIPSQSQVEAISADWVARADLPQHVVHMVNSFPNSLHPMSQFSAAITAMQLESRFARAYAEGMPKTKYWEYTFDDAMELIAKLPTLGSIIYRNTYQDGKVGAIDPQKDWSANFASMLGYSDPQFTGRVGIRHLCCHMSSI
jgi:citrate synthase